MDAMLSLYFEFGEGAVRAAIYDRAKIGWNFNRDGSLVEDAVRSGGNAYFIGG
jgi:hypothetical protein